MRVVYVLLCVHIVNKLIRTFIRLFITGLFLHLMVAFNLHIPIPCLPTVHFAVPRTGVINREIHLL